MLYNFLDANNGESSSSLTKTVPKTRKPILLAGTRRANGSGATKLFYMPKSPPLTPYHPARWAALQQVFEEGPEGSAAALVLPDEKVSEIATADTACMPHASLFRPLFLSSPRQE